jgi:enoyl-CoA hydratase/carnithine racemase
MPNPPAASSAVTLTRDGPVALIHFNRPPANSYDKAFMDGLNAAIDEVRFDESVHAAVLVSDLPGFFCAGADIKAYRNVTPQARTMTILHNQEILQKMERTPTLFIAAIAGHALGGGLEIALAADFRFAAEGEYRIGLPEVMLGLLPGNGGTQRLPRLIGRGRARDLLLTGKPVDPRAALELGLVNRLATPDQLLGETVDFARSLALGPTLAIGEIKTTARQGVEMPLEAGLALEREAIGRLFQSADAGEGLAAFAEKRQPSFRGE